MTEPTPVEQAIETIERRRLEHDFGEVKRLAEQTFPPSWDVRVVPGGKGAYVRVSFTIAEGRDPIDALKQAVAAYRQTSGSTIVLPK